MLGAGAEDRKMAMRSPGFSPALALDGSTVDWQVRTELTPSASLKAGADATEPDAKSGSQKAVGADAEPDAKSGLTKAGRGSPPAGSRESSTLKGEEYKIGSSRSDGILKHGSADGRCIKHRTAACDSQFKGVPARKRAMKSRVSR